MLTLASAHLQLHRPISGVGDHVGMYAGSLDVLSERSCDAKGNGSVPGESFRPVEADRIGRLEVVPRVIIYETWRRSVMTIAGLPSSQTSPPLYCPNGSVTRCQMASFLVRAFDL